MVADQPAEKLIKIGAKVVSHGRYVAFQMAEGAVPRQMFQDIPTEVAIAVASLNRMLEFGRPEYVCLT